MLTFSTSCSVPNIDSTEANDMARIDKAWTVPGNCNMEIRSVLEKQKRLSGMLFSGKHFMNTIAMKTYTDQLIPDIGDNMDEIPTVMDEQEV